MKPWKKLIPEVILSRISAKGKEKQPVASENTLVGPSANRWATRRTAATNEEQLAPTDFEEEFLSSSPAEDPARLANVNPRVLAGSSVRDTPLPIETFGLFEFPGKEPDIGQAALSPPPQNARYIE